ncbi:MAG: outer membrane beta-barrel protein [Prevotella sp.]|nr:outer membrane beta-barrel protein [Prevotella sp.]
MKKILVLAVAAMMATVSVHAQDEQKNEIGVFYGTGSASNILSVYTSAFAAATGDQGSWWGPIGVEYYYHVSPVVGVGAVAAYASCKAKDEKTNKDDLSEKFITVMPSVKFNWLRKKHFGMYSGLSAGIMLLSLSANDNAKANDPDAKDETLVSFMFQATALGMEFGGQQFRGFVEAGLGEKGVLCAGLRYKF